MASRELTARWLTQNAQRYRDPDRVFADVIAVLDRSPALRPKTDVYTYDDGRTQPLLCVHGLLPISFRGASYNIPIALWLPLPYPAEPPLAYVVPTADMLVKPSASVDLSGRCSLEYTAHWARKPDACSLSALLDAMQAVFSREPPLYSKPPSAAVASSASRPGPSLPADSQDSSHVLHSPPRPPPKPPGVLAAPSPPPVSPPNASTSASPYGPPPPLAQESSRPQTNQIYVTPTSSLATSGVSVAGSDPRSRPPPPLPPSAAGTRISELGPTRTGPTVQVAYTDSRQGTTASVGPGPPPYVAAPPIVPTRPPLGEAGDLRAVRLMSSQQLTITPTSASPPRPPAPPSVPPRPPYATGVTGLVRLDPMSSGLPYAASPPLTSPPNQVSQLTAAAPAITGPQGPVRTAPSVPAPDLLDTDDTPEPIPVSGPAAPPRPPNPQTVALHNALLNAMRDALTRLSETHADVLTRQRAQQAELLAGGPALADERARLTTVRDVCRSVGARWGQSVHEGEVALADVRRRGEVSVDELVCSSSIVGNQLINLVAEDNAIEDTMYHLHRALNSGRIDLERFLRTTRVLAEEQFMKRALIEKIVRGLPMGMSLG